MARILKGKEVAAAISERSLKLTEELKERGITPVLAIFRVGEKDADLSYERGAMKRCAETGVEVVLYCLRVYGHKQFGFFSYPNHTEICPHNSINFSFPTSTCTGH